MVPNRSPPYSDLHGTIELFMERALMHNYADLELCATLIFSTSVADIKKVIVVFLSVCV